MSQKYAAIFLFATGLALVPAIPAAVAQEGRYVMERTENGFVRLDTFTGEMSVCSQAEDQIVCRMVADERQALEEQIELLEERIAEIERSPGSQPADRPNQLPADEDIDRTFDIMEQMMRRFLGIIEEFDKESEDQAADPPKPEKT